MRASRESPPPEYPSSVVASGRLREHADQREGDDVRQVAHCREDFVVRLRRRACTMRAPHASQRPRTESGRRRSRSRDRREHDACDRGIARRIAAFGTAVSRPAIGMRRARNARSARAGTARACAIDILFRAAAIGDHGRRRARAGAIVAITSGICATGVAISTRSASRTALRQASRARVVDHARARMARCRLFARRGRRRRRADAPARFLQRQRKRAADQADADDDELVDLQLAASRAELTRAPARSASRKRAFSVRQPHGHAQPLAACHNSRPDARSRPLEQRAGSRAAHRRRCTITKLPCDGMYSSPRRVEARVELLACPRGSARSSCATNSLSSSAAAAAASASALTLNGWRTRFMRSATSGCANA